MKADSSLKVTELKHQVPRICFKLFLTFFTQLSTIPKKIPNPEIN